MSKITLIETKRAEKAINQELVDTLRRMLELAERGELTGVCAALSSSDGTITTMLESEGNNFAMSHALGALWFRFQKRMEETSTFTTDFDK